MRSSDDAEKKTDQFHALSDVRKDYY